MTNTNVIALPVFRQVTNRFNFTIQRLQQLPNIGKTHYAYDEGQAGLCMRITSGGSKSFVYSRKINGRPERMTLGKLGALSITDARKACKQYEGQRAAGGNPAADKRTARLKGAPVDDLMAAWVRDAEKRKLRRVVDEQRLYELHIKPSLGNKEAALITAMDIERIMRKLDDRPRTANKAHDLLRRVFIHAVKKRTVPDNPCKSITRHAETVRDRVLNKEEIQKFLAAVDAEKKPWNSFFKLLLLTGARKGAVAAMRWRDLDLESGIWTIPGWASENKKALAIALVPQAVEVINGIEVMDKEWVFPANSKSGYITEPRRSWDRIKKASGITDIRIHDIRRTLGTTLAINGASSHVIAKALGHKSLQSAQAYVHLEVETARAALEGATEGWLK